MKPSTPATLLVLLLAASPAFPALPPPRAIAPRGPLASDELNNIAVFKAASPAVVNITALGLERDFFSLDVQQVPQGTGTGFVRDTHGHVATNFHVIQGANDARVTLADQTSYKAELVGAFPDAVNRIVPRLIRDGRMVRPSLGVSGASPEVKRALGLPKGVALARVQRGGTAARAGLKPFARGDNAVVPGDVITAIDGEPIDNVDDMLTAFERLQPGDTCTHTLWRASKS